MTRGASRKGRSSSRWARHQRAQAILKEWRENPSVREWQPASAHRAMMWWPQSFNLTWWLYLFAIIALARGGASSLHLLDPYLKSTAMKWPIFWGAVAVSVALYLLRRHFRYWYGVFEVFFAACVIFDAAGSVSTGGVAEGLKLGAAIYVMIRGFDNCASGVTEMQKRLDERVAAERQARAEAEAEGAA